MFLRIILIFLAWLVFRRIYNMWRLDRARRAKGRPDTPASSGHDTGSDKYGDLTQQEVSDADFEEIP